MRWGGSCRQAHSFGSDRSRRCGVIFLESLQPGFAGSSGPETPANASLGPQGSFWRVLCNSGTGGEGVGTLRSQRWLQETCRRENSSAIGWNRPAAGALRPNLRGEYGVSYFVRQGRRLRHDPQRVEEPDRSLHAASPRSAPRRLQHADLGPGGPLASGILRQRRNHPVSRHAPHRETRYPGYGRRPAHRICAGWAALTRSGSMYNSAGGRNAAKRKTTQGVS